MGAAQLTDSVTVRGSLWAAGVFALALLLIYHETAWSMVSIWSRSDTFAHGFLILPISLWLIWNRREYFASVNPRPAWWVGLLLLPIGFGWLLAWLVDVSVIQQFALVAMIVVGVWAILGHKLGAMLAFPLFFLFFAVPIGEGLVDPMMEFTATTTVWMIQMTGIPVYREGLFFTLPTGSWSVVEACSGVRYIIASITVGVLYAYLTYRSWTRRLLFVLVSAIMPVFANTVRAYIIVMLGHMSDMTIATGADHLVYGWVFFGLVIFLLFWAGSFFREDHLDEPPVHADTTAVASHAGGSNRLLLATFTSTLLLAAIAPALAQLVFDRESAVRSTVSLPTPDGSYRTAPAPDWHWTPPSRVSGQTASYFDDGENTIGVMVQFANGEVEGAEVIGTSAWFTKDDSGWRVVGKEKAEVQGPEGTMVVDVAQLRGGRDNLLVWSWYVVGGISTSNDYQAKLQQTLMRLGFGDAGTYRVIVVTPLESPLGGASGRLQQFVAEYMPAVYESLRHLTPAAD